MMNAAEIRLERMKEDIRKTLYHLNTGTSNFSVMQAEERLLKILHGESQARLYRKRPIEVEAIQYRLPTIAYGVQDGGTWERVKQFIGDEQLGCECETNGTDMRCSECLNGAIWIRTQSGQALVRRGDWIIRGVAGELYPCTDEVFILTYERTES